MRSKGKAGHGSEVAAAAAQRPEQFGFIVFAHARQEFALGRDNVCFHQIIDRQAATARERPKATALGPSPAAALRTPAAGRCIAARASREVDLPPEGAAA